MSEEAENKEVLNPLPDLVPVKQEYNLPNEHADIDSIFTQLVNLNSDNILHEPTCVICSSPQRKEIEEKWKETKSPSEVKKYYKTVSDFRLSDDIIDNHMRFHFDRGVPEWKKLEYANKIKRISNIELTTLDRIRLGLAAVDERIMGINSIMPNSDLSMAEVEQIKSAEVARLMGAYNNLLKLKSNIMGEMVNQGDLIIIPKQYFIEAFNNAIADSKNEEEKNSIMRLLINLKDLNKKTQ